MAHIASGIEVATSSRRRNAGSNESRTGKCNPRSRRVNRAARADDFAAFADQVRRDLNPRGPLEFLAAERVVTAAWTLKGAVEQRADRRVADRSNPDGPADPPKKASPTAADRAARSVKEALELLDLARGSRAEGADLAPEVPFSEFHLGEIEPNEWPIVPFEDPGESPVVDDEPPIWRDRLIFDFEVSETSPVVKGTWITVGHVVSLIVDGETWADILRSHPELTEDDIRSCVAYAIAQDQDED